MTIFYLAYASEISLKARFDKNCFTDISNEALRFNSRHAITGFLSFGNGYFFQYIEGPKDQLEILTAKIAADSRYQKFKIILQGAQDNRRFAEWAMFCINLEQTSLDERIASQFEDFEPLNWSQSRANEMINEFGTYYQAPNYPTNKGFEPPKSSYQANQVQGVVKRHRNFLLVQALLILVTLVTLFGFIVTKIF